MPLVSKTLEVNADAAEILRIVADFESYPQWNDEVRAVYILARYNDGRPSQLRIDTEVQGHSGTYIQAVYYPSPAQIQTVMQQGDLFSKQEQLFSVVEMGPLSLLTVDFDVETSFAVPAMMVKKLVNDALEHLANNLKVRAEELSSGS
jgi:ribosome-associated toxin RatA of RatAB toxin-antitoxin module